MNLDHAEEFIVLAKECNFNKAAKELSIAQSTLSKHIRLLEEDLGVSLFNHGKQSVSLSEFGKLFLPYAMRLVDVRKRYFNAIEQEKSHGNHILRIGLFPTTMFYGVMDLCQNFQSINGGISIRYVDGETRQLQSLLRQQRLDLAFCRETEYESSDEFNRELLTEDTLVAVLPAGHPLAKSESVSIEQLAQEPWLLTAKDSLIHKLGVEALEKYGTTPNIIYCGSGENLFDLISHNAGISILAKRPTTCLADASLAVIDICPRITTHINVIYPRMPQVPPVLDAFLAYIREARHQVCP